MMYVNYVKSKSKSKKLIKGGSSTKTKKKKETLVEEEEYINQMKKISLIDFMLSLFQELITFTIDDKSIYDFMIDYINKKNIIIKSYEETGVVENRLVIIRAEIDSDSSFEIFEEIFESEIEKHIGKNVVVRLIYHKEEEDNTGTHFMVKEKTTQQKDMISGSYEAAFCDPYEKWQKQGSQGYCQMYSLFCTLTNHKDARGDLYKIITPNDFIDIDSEMLDSLDRESLEECEYQFAENNYLCTQKTLAFIEYICNDITYPDLTKDLLSHYWNMLKDEISVFVPTIVTVNDLFNVLESFQVDDWLLFGKLSPEDILSVSIENKKKPIYSKLEEIIFYFMYNKKRIKFKL